jgi:hypothetical protein
MSRLAAVGFCLVASFASMLSAEDQPKSEEGFVSLFDGKTYAGWQGNNDGYAITDGAFVCQPKGGGNLYTDKEYADFPRMFEFMLTVGANYGIGLRSALCGDPA